MEFSSLAVVLWQVCLIEALICLILLVGVILATGRWRMAIRRALAGVSKGARARVERKTVDEAGGEAKGWTGFSSTIIAEYAMHLKKRISAVLWRLGYTMSSLTKRRKRRASLSERFSSEMDEYTAHLKNHANAVHSLTRVSQELKDEVSEQRRVLSDLIMAVEQAPVGLDSKVEHSVKPGIIKAYSSTPAEVSKQDLSIEEEPLAKHEEGVQIPGHFRCRQHPDEKQKAAIEKAPAKKLSLPTRHTLATRELLTKHI